MSGGLGLLTGRHRDLGGEGTSDPRSAVHMSGLGKVVQSGDLPGAKGLDRGRIGCIFEVDTYAK